MSDIEVTVITPMYNARAWLEGHIASTRAQTLRNFEHIIIDDCSTDDSVAVAQQLTAGDDRYKIVRAPKNGGPAAARNIGIAQAKGRYLAFLDADDLWLPQKLERQLAFMKRTGYAFTYHDYCHISHDGSKIGKRIEGVDTMDIRALHVRRKGTCGCLSVMIDHQQLPDFKFPDIERSLPEDFLAWLWVMKQGQIGHRLPEDLARYRLVPASRSANKFAAAFAVWNLYYRVEKLPLIKATWWWLHYAWNTKRLHKESSPEQQA
ncbi:MAG TPA: glycosyltransferase family 2 protein [Aquabacterium sp.]|uniref:glycosyltransferase family 2 protein n=1 Tax=Aquabacterium sp. TaxID=1872578 RepID=UPI002E31F6BA|nr:glycosyltransferase family 2 protein [Aquabacterium sp.]HEX5358055.1 glycosyltransferase family 2 protein [Aquabacterium sp.]